MKRKEIGGAMPSNGCKFPHKFRQKKYFNAAHTLDLGLNDDKSSLVYIFGH